MPHFTGYEVATRIKVMLPQVPVVALTADMSENVRERALASGCDGYIAKPIDPDAFVGQVAGFLGGLREELEDESFRAVYQQTLVVRLEEKVRELTAVLEENAALDAQRVQLLKEAQRRARLLEASARVSKTITSILDLDALLRTTVRVIAEAFGFCGVDVYLADSTGRWFIRRVRLGETVTPEDEAERKYEIGSASLVGAATERRSAVLSGNCDIELDPGTCFESDLVQAAMALPLIVGDKVIGAVTIHSPEEDAFGHEDLTTLQTMADQLAIAIDNARLLADLESAHAELVRTKTFEAIATATGEAIHWVGNKAAPIPGSVARVREDVVKYFLMAREIVAQAPSELQEHKYAQMLVLAGEDVVESGLDLAELEAELERRPLRRLRRMLNVDSVFEDLNIVEQSARSILNIKEDLIGPARQKRVVAVSLPDVLRDTVRSMGLPDAVVRFLFAEEVSPVLADLDQLHRVFINLIKNAMEAMEQVEDKKLFIWVHPADDPQFVVAEVTDNGEGIPPEVMDKIWVAFYTTKGDRGGTGLGLPACAKIVNQLGGKITVESIVGEGTTFSVHLPVVKAEAI